MEVELEDRQVEVTGVAETAITTDNEKEVVVGSKDLDVTANVKEYVIIGDEVFVPKLYDDAPQWMKDLVNISVDVVMQTENTEILNNVNSLLSNFATSYVPLNTYTQAINQLTTEDSNLLSQIETLNSNFNDGLNQTNANVLNIQQTYATSDSVAATVANALSTELTNPNSVLGSTIANLNTAITSGDSTNATSIQALESSLQGEVDANASAFQSLGTRVTAAEEGVSTNANDITTLTTEVNNGTNTWAAADSTLRNTLTTKIDEDTAAVESKFEYNSLLFLNGVSYNSGFGLVSSTTNTGTTPNPVVTGSEFWIRADKFRLVTANQSGAAKEPFSVDGVSGDITFNGKVSFNSVTDKDDVVLNADIDANNNDFAKKLGYVDYTALVTAATLGKTIINGGYINTDLLQANSIVASQINTDNLSFDTGIAGVMYNQGGNAGNYTMKIDFTNGEIHIK